MCVCVYCTEHRRVAASGLSLVDCCATPVQETPKALIAFAAGPLLLLRLSLCFSLSLSLSVFALAAPPPAIAYAALTVEEAP